MYRIVLKQEEKKKNVSLIFGKSLYTSELPKGEIKAKKEINFTH